MRIMWRNVLVNYQADPAEFTRIALASAKSLALGMPELMTDENLLRVLRKYQEDPGQFRTILNCEGVPEDSPRFRELMDDE